MSDDDGRAMSRRGLVFLVISALVVIAGISLVLRGDPHAGPIPDLTFRDEHGNPFRLSQLRGRYWVAGIVPGGSDVVPTLAALEELRGELPAETALVCFVVGPGSTIDAGVRFDPPGMLLIDPRMTVRGLALEHFAFPTAAVEELERGDAMALLASVDRMGWVRAVRELSPGAVDRVKTAIVSEALFLEGLRSRPWLHARLNATSGLLLTLGFLFVRQRMIRCHVACMVLAALTSSGFLVSYLYYHAHAGSMPFVGPGWVRLPYLAILLTHTLLAAVVAPLALTVLFHAVRGRFSAHRRVARWTLPLWLYVSVTGVVIYFLLYVWFTGAAE